ATRAVAAGLLAAAVTPPAALRALASVGRPATPALARAAPATAAHADQFLHRLAGNFGVVRQAQPDAPALAVHLHHAYGDLVAPVEHVLDAVHALARGYVGDVQEAVGALGQLDERAESGGLDDLAHVLVADLHLLEHHAHALHERIRELPIG